MIIGLKILIWLITTVLLSGCTLGPTNASGPAPVPADRSTEVSRRPATFTESYRWVDGLAVEVVEGNHGRLLASIPVDSPTARVGDSCSELTIVVRNGSDHVVRIALTARLRYGPDLTSAPSYVATAGHADHATAQFVVEVPQNAWIVDFLDFRSALPETSVFVTNGGWGGVLASLAAGVPQVIAGGDIDKPAIAAWVARAGAGINLRTGQPKPEAVAAAVREILTDPGYAKRARQIGVELATLGGAQKSADLLEHLVETAEPVRR